MSNQQLSAEPGQLQIRRGRCLRANGSQGLINVGSLYGILK
jgi:hypothetical protein